MHWLIEGDRTLGSSHAEQSLPCQDNICYVSKGNWHSVCISDGAGSSKFSEISSKFVSERFSQSLLLLADLIEVKGPGSWINDHIIHDVLELRGGLKEHTASTELDDYHCTLVAILVSQSVAIAVHIGDGAIIAGKCKETSGSSSFLNGTLVASLPENGEYKNETYFITEPHWLKHLRIKVLGKVDWFVMGSDGGIDILSDRQKLDGLLVADLINHISCNNEEESTVSQLIGSEYAASKTTDDISLAIGWIGPKGVQKDLVWDEALSKGLYLDPDADVGNRPLNPIPGNPAAEPSPSDRLRTGWFPVIFNFSQNRSAIRLLAIFVLSIVLVIFAYLFFRSENESVALTENQIASTANVEEKELSDSDSDSVDDGSGGSDLGDEPVESELGHNEEVPMQIPQDMLELQEEPSESILYRIMKIWSSIFGRGDIQEPLTDETVPRAVEPIEL